MHILTNPYLKLLIMVPRPIKEMAEIYLDGEKYKINNYAAKMLLASGYRYVYYVNRLHSKVIVIGSRPDYIVIGSSNLSERSFTNLEAIVIFENPNLKLYEQLKKVLILPAVKNRYDPATRFED